jgi:hypothetical protein
MRRFDFALIALACVAACGKSAEPPATLQPVTPAPAEAPPAAPAPANPEPAPAAPEHAPAPAANRPEPGPAKSSTTDQPKPKPEPADQAAMPAANADKSRPARTQSSIETEKLNRAHPAPAPSAVPAEPIAEAPQPEPSAPEPTPAPPPPAAKPAGGKVSIPNTARVHVEVPAGLQRWLDADTRMQPWLNKVMPVIDTCYGNVLSGNANAKGTISFRVTMHANARPDPDVQSLPGELSGIVTCATGQLMRIKMPLFTGTEGESYTVKVRFGD